MTQRQGSAKHRWNVKDFLADDVHRDLGLEILNLYENDSGIGLSPQFQTGLQEKISLSLIIPYIKHEPTLGRAAIASLLKQNYLDYEIILVASGFSYEIPEELAELLTQSRIKFFYYPGSLSLTRLVR